MWNPIAGQRMKYLKGLTAYSGLISMKILVVLKPLYVSNVSFGCGRPQTRTDQQLLKYLVNT